MKVAVTGAGGQLGTDITECLRNRGCEVTPFRREQLDVSSFDLVERQLGSSKFDAIIHTAAYTKVDLAETEADEAYRVNAYGTRNVAVIAEKLGAKLVYVSTDYVFDGAGLQPYDEFMPALPKNVYGKTKLAGEQFVQQLHSRFFIVRTSWAYGKHGHNFVRTMLKLAEEHDSVSVVDDQVGCPTYTVDLAACIAALIHTECYGTYHVSNTGSCSWYDFARSIFELGGWNTFVQPIPTELFPRPAKRPAYSVMAHKALERNGFPPMRHWKEALAEFLNEYNNEA
ncbi:dTDP-4-dehydrorhamnose reductase [Paenibacillus spongiae]|uniref:dTDP-4-dehydrorhamnose reductase n=1 Tax=Paenibacillus spongiae TaxID=2909671 RepID=A0ABY5SDM3_9BACL|nr:dTDP-4-dehydrorhamnose reductase [Paenibacillus spongiae]UVI31625.1 dTDP-4-dehydrorhamnose reductase [Paenibacillus spongiae]